MIFLDWVRLSRWREWCQSKLLYIIAATLLLEPSVTPVLLFKMIGTILFWAAFGYGINEVSDRNCDILAGKRNRAASLPPASWILFLLLTACSAFGLCLLWAEDVAAPTLLLAGLALAFAYSVPPIRLKERGIWGLIAGAAAQWGLPVLAMSAVEPAGWLRPSAWSLSLLGLSIGIRWMAVHQLQDSSTDVKGGVRTYASTGGSVWPVILGAFLSELGFLTVSLILTWPRSMPAVAALGLWILQWTLVHFPWRGMRTILLGYNQAPLAEYYFLLLPVSLALSHVQSSLVWIGIAVFLIVLGSPYLQRIIRDWYNHGRSNEFKMNSL